jgi:cell wall-associated NlpC family hydrolase
MRAVVTVGQQEREADAMRMRRGLDVAVASPNVMRPRQTSARHGQGEQHQQEGEPSHAAVGYARGGPAVKDHREARDVARHAVSIIMADLKGVGVDCVMLPIAVGKAVGVIPADYDPRPYPRGWFLRDSRYLDMLAPFVVPRDGTPQPGDIALFRVGRAPAHAAIVVAWPRVIHADPEGVVEETDAVSGSTPGRFVCAVTPRAPEGLADGKPRARKFRRPDSRKSRGSSA